MKEIIQSRQNPKVRFVCGLTEKKKRRESGLFRFDGIKLFREAVECKLSIHSVYVREPVGEEISALLRYAMEREALYEEQIVFVSESVFEKLSEEKSPEGILCVADMPKALHPELSCSEAVALLSGDRESAWLFAESIRDPGNLGTVIRTSAALGIDRLILSADCADLYHAKTVRSAMGAIFRLPVVLVPTAELPVLISSLREKGRKIYAAALCPDAKTIGSFSLRKGDCFVIGNEGHGLSSAVIEATDGAAIIPMREGNESLNAAAAAAICIWETVRAK
ncbi:MAG: RNA methyltransferase [Clostridia bacterium]|nr:RNA methyltransferase [Clostridia bacterium]